MGRVQSPPRFAQGYARRPKESLYPELWKGLVAAYVPEMGSSGTKYRNLVSSFHQGDSTGNPTFYPGKGGLALKLDGSTQYITVAHHVYLNLHTAFSVVSLFKATVNTGDNQAIINKGLGANIQESWCLQIAGGANLNIALKGNGASPYIKSPTNLNLNQWYVGAGTVDNGSGIVYLDGKQEATGSKTWTDNTQPVYIGVHQDDSSNPTLWFFNGQIGIILVYNRALKPQEVKLLSTNPFLLFQLKPTIQAEIKPATVQTIFSDALILVTQTKTILSDTDIKNTTVQTILSDADIVNTTIQTIFSDADIQNTTIRTIFSNADIFNTTTRTILSDTLVVSTSSQTILSDALILATEIKTILSDADIKATTIRTILSDADITASIQVQIFSDADIKATTTRTILSDSTIVITQNKTILSDAIILTPLDLQVEVGFTNTLNIDKYFRVEVIQVTPGVPFNVVALNVGNGDSISIEWDGTAPFFNVYRVDSGPTYVKLNTRLIKDHFFVIGGLQENASYEFIVRGADGQG